MKRAAIVEDIPAGGGEPPADALMLRKAAIDDNPGEDDVVRGAMVLLCVCGARMPYLFDAFDCPTCGRACCPDCAVLMESAWYCTQCAEAPSRC